MPGLDLVGICVIAPKCLVARNFYIVTVGPPRLEDHIREGICLFCLKMDTQPRVLKVAIDFWGLSWDILKVLTPSKICCFPIHRTTQKSLLISKSWPLLFISYPPLCPHKISLRYWIMVTGTASQSEDCSLQSHLKSVIIGQRVSRIHGTHLPLVLELEDLVHPLSRLFGVAPKEMKWKKWPFLLQRQQIKIFRREMVCICFNKQNKTIKKEKNAKKN